MLHQRLALAPVAWRRQRLPLLRRPIRINQNWEQTHFIHRYLYPTQEVVVSTQNLQYAKEQRAQTISETVDGQVDCVETYVQRIRVSTKLATSASNRYVVACDDLGNRRCRQRRFHLFATKNRGLVQGEPRYASRHLFDPCNPWGRHSSSSPVRPRLEQRT